MLKDLISKNIEKINDEEQKTYIQKYVKSKDIQRKLLLSIKE